MNDLPNDYAGPAFLATDDVNLRNAPEGGIIRALDLGDAADVLGMAPNPAWRRVRIAGTEGYVAGRYLRSPKPPRIEALLAAATAEWLRFGKGGGLEYLDPYYKYVGEMWRAIDLNLDGRDRETPWSAAFISWAVRKAGAGYEAFKFAASHSVFVHDAIQARLLARLDRPFWGYRITQQTPALGDIVARNRSGNTYSFDFAESHSQYISHSDIVVEVRPGMIRVMGGNVGQTVSLNAQSGGDNSQEYDLDANGFIKPGQMVIALLKNRAAEV